MVKLFRPNAIRRPPQGGRIFRAIGPVTPGKVGPGKGKGPGTGPGKGPGAGPGKGPGKGKGKQSTGLQATADTVIAQSKGDNNAQAHSFAASGGGSSGGSGAGRTPLPEPNGLAAELLEIGIWTYTQPSGIDGGAHNDTTYRDRVLNTEVYNGIPGASLSNNAITLPAGIYEIEFHAQVAGTHNATIRIWNDTAGTLIGYGVNDVPENTVIA